MTLASLRAVTVSESHRMKKSEVKELCLKRGLDASGSKADVQIRLASYRPLVEAGAAKDSTRSSSSQAKRRKVAQRDAEAADSTADAPRASKPFSAEN